VNTTNLFGAMHGPFMKSVRAKFLTALVMTLALPLARCGRVETEGMGSGGAGGVTGGTSTGGAGITGGASTGGAVTTGGKSTGGTSTGGVGVTSGGAVGAGGSEGRIVCLANQHVQANACVACGLGSTNAAGDDAQGANTSCDDACTVAFGVRCGEFEEGYLKASNTGAGSRFGASVSLSGDTLAVGAIHESSAATGVNGDQNSSAASGSGAVYVFTRSAGVWSQQAYLKASNTATNDLFGFSVSVFGDTLAVGAPGEASAATGVDGDQSSDAARGSGAVYVLRRSAGV